MDEIIKLANPTDRQAFIDALERFVSDAVDKADVSGYRQGYNEGYATGENVGHEEGYWLGVASADQYVDNLHDEC